MANMEKDLVNDKQIEELEALVDRFSLANVLEALVTICHEKADHLEGNWQDKNAARAWDNDGRKIDRIIRHIENAG